MTAKKNKPKTLVIVVHPDLKNSVLNKRWITALQREPDKFEVHDLYAAYPDEQIDIAREQQLLESYDTFVLQFPFYWFSAPPLLKKWFDEVLTYGWAYGSKSGYKLAGKKVALAITVGIDEKEYKPEGLYKYSLAELTTPFELTFQYVKADYLPAFAYYGMERNASADWVEKSVPAYLDFLAGL